jgi:CRISPR/Cas system CSM-associated protein Csm5 (group 7 of RAMP superfamily)
MKIYGDQSKVRSKRKDAQAKADRRAKADLRAVGIRTTTDSVLQSAQIINRYLTTRRIPGSNVKGSVSRTASTPGRWKGDDYQSSKDRLKVFTVE